MKKRKTPNTNAGNVVWGLEYWVHNFETPAALTTTVITVTAPAPGVKWQEAIHSFPPIPGTNLRESTVLLCRVFRQAASGSDTYASDAIGLSLDFHYQIEKPGTVAEFPA